MMNSHERLALDRHITGNYGEDGVADERDEAQPETPIRGWCQGCTPDNCMGCATRPNPYQLKVKRVHPDAQLPQYATAGAACFDVCAVGIGQRTQLVQPGQAHTFRTGLAFEVPDGWVMHVYSRSGHGFKQGVRLANCVGVIDSDYRGELMARLVADPQGQGIGVRDGDRIAQCMLVRAPQWAFMQADELSDTARGAGGFGSTGR